MSTGNTSPWMVSPERFVRLLGAEYGMLREAGLLKRFYCCSLLIIIIMGLTWMSIQYAIKLLFHTAFAEWSLAIFFSLLFLSMYIFLLNTFSKENGLKKTVLSASNIVRTGFVAFMGFLISQPLVIMLYLSTLSPAIEQYKQQLLHEHTVKIGQLSDAELVKLAAKRRYYLEQQEKFQMQIYEQELAKIDNIENTIRQKAASLTLAAAQTINKSSFFLFQVERINHRHPLSWFFTAFIILLFLLPGYLIYKISAQHEYYEMKKAREKKIVMDAYHFFTAQHRKIFNEQVAIFCRYEDPPFNTIRKEVPKSAAMSDFLQKYLDNDSHNTKDGLQ